MTSTKKPQPDYLKNQDAQPNWGAFDAFTAPQNPEKVPEHAGILRTAGDMAIKGAQGVVGLGQAAVGIGSLATGGLIGEGMRGIGYDPNRTKEALGEYLSDDQKAADAAVQGEDTFLGAAGATIANPRALAGSIVESLPGMIAGMGVASSAARAIGAKAAAAYGGMGTEAGAAAAKAAIEKAGGKLMAIGAGTEGAQTAGQIADDAQAAGRTYGEYAPAAVAAGLGTAAIGMGAGKLMGDAATDIATGARTLTGSKAAKVGKEVLSEGVLEEMPQSAQEQVFTNVAQGEANLGKGVANAAGMGLVVGGAMGGGMGMLHSDRAATPAPVPVPVPLPDTGPLSRAANAVQAAAASQAAAAPGTPAAPAAPGAAPVAAPSLAEIDARMAALVAIGRGTNSRRAIDAEGNRVDVPGVPGRLFTPAEKAEYEALKQARAARVAIPADQQGEFDTLLAQEQAEKNKKFEPALEAAAANRAATEQAAAESRDAAERDQIAAMVQADDQLRQQTELVRQQQDLDDIAARVERERAARAESNRAGLREDVLADASIPADGKKAAFAAALERAGYRDPTLNELDHQEIDAAIAPLPSAPNELLDAVPERKEAPKGAGAPNTQAVDAAIAAGMRLKSANGSVLHKRGSSKIFRLSTAQRAYYDKAIARQAGGEAVPVPLNAPSVPGMAETVPPVADLAAPATPLDQAAHAAATSPLNDLAAPTQAQKDAGNYKVGRVRLHGMDLSIENPTGSTRSGVDKDGKPWETTMNHHYGYIRGTVGADKDHIDTFIGPNHDSDKVFVVDQIHPDSGKFDEHKVMLGFNSLEQAREAYQSNYDASWTGGRHVTETTVEGFKDWLASGKTKKPFAKKTGAEAATPAAAALPEPRVRAKLLAIAKRLGIAVDQSGSGFHASAGMVFIPAEDAQVDAAITPEHVFAHELGHAIMQKRGISFKGYPKSEMLKWASNWDALVAASKAYRPAAWGHADERIRRHANKPNEVLADAIGSVLIGEHPVSLLAPLMERTGTNIYDLGLEDVPARKPAPVEPAPARDEQDPAAAAGARKLTKQDLNKMTVKDMSDAELLQAREVFAGAARAPKIDKEIAARGIEAEPAAKVDAAAPVTAEAESPEPGMHANATAPEHVQIGVDDRELGQIVDEFNAAQAEMMDGNHPVSNIFQPPKKGEVVRLNDKAKVYHKDHGWMTPAEARAKIEEWKAHAQGQGENDEIRRANSQRVVLSLFDLSGEWSRPWEEAGYQVYRFDIQDDAQVGDVNNFSTEFFADWFGDFEGQEIYAILAATPCTDFASSGARHFAAKDKDGRTVASVKLVHQTLRTIEHFKPSVWALENPVGRIESLGGLPPWRLSFDPNHLGDPYTKKTLIWGRFNGDLPVAPVEPTEGSKMHKLYGGKSMATKNARSVTPEGFSYGFFIANNAHDNPVMAIANKWDRLDRAAIEQAVAAGVTEDEISGAVEDFYYMDLDDDAANEAIRELTAEKLAPEPEPEPEPEPDPEPAPKKAKRATKAAVTAAAETPAPAAQPAAQAAQDFGRKARDVMDTLDQITTFEDVATAENLLFDLADEMERAKSQLGALVRVAADSVRVFKNINAGDKTHAKEGASVRSTLKNVLEQYPAPRAPSHVEQITAAAAEKAPAADPFANNKLFTSDAVEKARARMKSKLGTLNSGIDPELMMDGITIAGAYIEAGVRSFAAFSKAMIGDLGEGVRPYLRSFYEGARHYPGLDTAGMSTAAEIDAMEQAAQAVHASAVARTQLANPVTITDTETTPAPAETKEQDNDSTPASSAPAVNPPVADGQPAGSAADNRSAGEPRARAGRGDDRSVRGPRGRGQGADDGRPELGNQRGNTAVSDRAPVAVGGSDERVSADFRPDAGGLTREGSWFDTAKRNIDLIELALTIERENRPATAAEQAQLSKYVGFGASAIRNKLFPIPPAYSKQQDPNRLIWPNLIHEASWRALAERMEALPAAWQRSVLQSSQYAHYTSEGIIRSTWGAMQRLGFTGGKVFEPGMGIGSFAMLMPETVRATSRYTGVEFDGPTALIARLLSPAQNMLHDDFIKRKFPKDFFDVAIGNPPFSQTQIFADPDYEKHGFMLHDFFFAKSIDRVRPGGLLAFVTSKGTMDKQTDKARKYLAARADLLGAIRLPSTAFEDNAGTSVVTDVIFLRKRADGEAPAGQAWANVASVDTKDGVVVVNEYFANHPDMVLGQNRISGNVDDIGRRINSNGRGGEQYTVVSYDSTPAELDAKFAAAVERLPANVYSVLTQSTESVQRETAKVDFDPSVKREGVVYLAKDGTIMRVENGVGQPLEHGMKMTEADKAWFAGYVGLRDLVQEARLAQATDGKWEASLKKLNKAYDAFRAEHGPINDFRVQVRKSTDEDGKPVETESRIFKNRRRFREDYDSAILTQLETINEAGEIVKSPFLLGRTIGKPMTRDVKTIGDALAVSLDETGRLNLDDVGRRIGLTREETIEALGNQVFQAPAGDWQLADEYLSGDVVSKLEEAEQAARLDDSLARNVEALKQAQPEKLGPSQISAKLGASWIPAAHVNAFAAEIDAGSVTFDPKTETWQVDGGNLRSQRRAGAEYGTAARSPSELLESALNSRSVKITNKIEGKTVTDQEATTAANEMLKKIKDKFKGWVWTDSERATELVESYNRRFNNIAPRRFDGSHLTLPGVSMRYNLHPHQKRAIWRMVQTGDTYLAHAVGSGKTIEMIAGGMEQKRLGLINKPMYVVPNHMLEQFANEFMELYPLANIMVADDENFSAERRKAFIASATLNNPDAVIITHDAFQRIGVKEESVAPIRDEILADLEIELSETAKDNGARVRRSQLEQQIEAVTQRFDRIIAAGGKDSTLKFEDIGVDFIFADEAHVFRKLDFHTSQQIKGIDPNGSKRALDMYVKTRWLQSQRPGRAMVFASGTPVTNTMGELYTIMRFFAPEEMNRAGIATFDAWARQFGEVAPALEPNAAGKYELIERFAKFDNVPELMSRVRQFMDVLTSEHLGALVKRPDLIGGKPNLNIVAAGEDLERYMKNVLGPRIEKSKRWKPTKDEPNNPDPIVSIITDGRFAAIDPRFFGGTLGSEGSIITEMGDKVVAAYHAGKNNVYQDKNGKDEPNKGSTQIVFYNMGFGEQSQKNRGFNSRAAFTKRLTDGGIPRDQIAWFDDASTDAKKEAVFKDMRSGKLRVLIGSAKKMGTGVNVQKRLAVLHYQDPPWFPADVEQPHGRIIRQGNQNAEVAIEWYTTKGTYQSTMWQMVGRKQRFIDQAFSGDKTLRSMEDMGEASLFEQAAAVASGDPRAIQLAGLKQEVERFERLQAAHASEQISVRSALRGAEWQVESAAKRINSYGAAFKAIGERFYSFTTGKVGSALFDKVGEFGQAVKDAFNQVAADAIMGTSARDVQIGTLGENLALTVDAEKVNGKEKGEFTLYVTVGDLPLSVTTTSGMGETVDAVGLGRRIVNQVNSISNDLARAKSELATGQTDLIRLRKKTGAPFEYQQEMVEKYGELKRLEEELRLEGLTPAAVPVVINEDGATAEEAVASADDQAAAEYFRGDAGDFLPALPAGVDDGAPAPAELTGVELLAAKRSTEQLNRQLVKAGMAPVRALRAAPTAHFALARQIGETLGIEVNFVSKNPDFDGVAYKGIAYIAEGMRNAELAIAGHETLHALEQSNPDLGAKLRSQIRAYLKDGVVEDRQAREYAANGLQDVSIEQAEAEVIADINGAMWIDPVFWSDLAKADRSLFRSVAYKFMELATKAISSLRGSRFDTSALVKDVAAVRAIMVSTWAEHNAGRDAAPLMVQQPENPRYNDPYATLQTRPDTVEAQRDAGRAAIADISRRLGVDRIREGDLQSGSAASVLGSRMYANFVAGKPNQLVGQVARTPHDLAMLAQVYRDPRFETFRMFFTKGDTIVGEAGYTSRLPALASLPLGWEEWAMNDMVRFGADGYYIIHNHPSGSPDPSDNDINLTQKFGRVLGGFRGHVIIDHNKYVVMDATGAWKKYGSDKMNAVDFKSKPELEHRLLGVTVAGPDDVAVVAKALQIPKGHATMLLMSGEAEVQLVVDVPMGALRDFSKLGVAKTKALVRRMARESGSAGGRVMVLPAGVNAAQFRRWVELGVFHDVISSDGSVASRTVKPGADYLREAGGRIYTVNQPVAAFDRIDGGPFYSALAAALPGMRKIADKAGMVTPDQATAWLAARQKEGKFKAEELQWSGLTDWIAMQPGKVSVDSIGQFAANNGVQLQEVHKTQGKELPGATIDQLRQSHPDDFALLQGQGFEPVPHDDEDGHLMFWQKDDDNYLDARELRTDYGVDRNTEAAAKRLAAAFQIPERVDSTKYGQYVLPGGENYHELLLTVPARGARTSRMSLEQAAEAGLLDESFTPEGGEVARQQDYQSSHWDEKNVIAHVRFNDRVDADGNKVLFIEELQSDWGQEGLKRGFAGPGATVEERQAAAANVAAADDNLDAEKSMLDKYSGDIQYWQEKLAKLERDERTPREDLESASVSLDKARDQKREQMKVLDRASAALVDAQRAQNLLAHKGQGTAAAPFVTKTEGWLQLGIKRMIAYAVEHGYDKVAFVSGQQSADRYDLSKHIDYLEYRRDNHGGGNVIADGPGGVPVISKVIKNDGDLEAIVGKEVAQKLLAQTPVKGRSDESYVLEGAGLQVGGEGMKTFYDKIVPQNINAVLKKLGGGKVEQVRLPSPEAKITQVGGMFSVEGREFSTMAMAEDWVSKYSTAGVQPGFAITDALRGEVASGLPLFSRANLGDVLANAAGSIADVRLPADYRIGDLFNSSGKVSWWHKTIGTMDNLAKRAPAFAKVYDAVQAFLGDVSRYAVVAADLAPTLLPKLENIADIVGKDRKKALTAADTKAIGAPIFEGTLMWARDAHGNPVKIAELEQQAAGLTTAQRAQILLQKGIIDDAQNAAWLRNPLNFYERIINSKFEETQLKAGIVWTESELRSMFNLTDGQVALYGEFRAAINKSLTNLTISEMVKLGGKDAKGMIEQAVAAPDLTAAGDLLRDHFMALAEMHPEQADMHLDTAKQILNLADKGQDLMDRGYAPLSRFGKYTVYVQQDGEQVYFGMFETQYEASKMARDMAAEHPAAQISHGTISEDAYKLFAGVSPETIELFGSMVGLDSQADAQSTEVYQTYLKLAKNNRSSMKRLIHRKGIAGFSEDAGRVLAGFVYSNARLTAGNAHLGEIDEAVTEIPKQQGELTDAAMQLREHIRNPEGGGSALGGLMFAQFLGGSVASAMVNLTQPFTMTLPYLSQWGGIGKAGKRLAAAIRDAGKESTGDAQLDAALQWASDEGIVAPQEVHYLQAQSQGKGALRAGDGTRAGNTRAHINNVMAKVSLGWGKLFAMAELANRRITFIAAYRTAVEEGRPNPERFAQQAVSQTQGTYNSGNKPKWARNTIGSLLMTFKQYSIAYLELLSRMAFAGEPGSKERAAGRRAALYMIAVLFLMGGADGLPFEQDLEDALDGILQRLGYNFSTKRSKQAFLTDVLGQGGADFVLKGISAAPGMPIDVAGRFGMGNLIPGTGLLTKKDSYTRDLGELAGPAGDLAKRAFTGAGKALGGDLAGAALDLSPASVRNLAKGVDMLDTGSYRDTRGYIVNHTTPSEAVMKMIGFQPNSTADVQDQKGQALGMIGQNRMRSSEIAEHWAQGLANGNPAMVQEARDMRADWNRKNPETPIKVDMPAIIRRVRAMRQDAIARTQKTAPAALKQTVRAELAETR
jgi:N12 class adenine-specific DNA methylase/tRNA1(Val) A37 N6-methylase TrmN6